MKNKLTEQEKLKKKHLLLKKKESLTEGEYRQMIWLENTCQETDLVNCLTANEGVVTCASYKHNSK